LRWGWCHRYHVCMHPVSWFELAGDGSVGSYWFLYWLEWETSSIVKGQLLRDKVVGSIVTLMQPLPLCGFNWESAGPMVWQSQHG
jgi:hypothetical protein